MPVLIDYAIFIQFLISIDNGVNNIYWVIYDREVDKKLTLAVWDLDWSLGTNRDSPTFAAAKSRAHLRLQVLEQRVRYASNAPSASTTAR